MSSIELGGYTNTADYDAMSRYFDVRKLSCIELKTSGNIIEMVEKPEVVIEAMHWKIISSTSKIVI